MLQNLPNIEFYPDLKAIGEAFTEGHAAFHGPDAISDAVTTKFLELMNEPDKLADLFQEMEEDNSNLMDELTEAITDIIDRNFKKRDDSIWKYMNDNYPSLKYDYVMYKPEISGFDGHTHNCGISLTKAGVVKYNDALSKVSGETGAKSDSIHPLIFSKYYRGITKKSGQNTPSPGATLQPGDSILANYKVVQRALPVEFAQVSYSYHVIKALCEHGFDKEKLSQMYPLDKYSGFNAISKLRPEIHPKDHYVGYDEHTGLCKCDTTNKDWLDDGYCTYMNYQDNPKMLDMDCEGDGCQNKQYPVCYKTGSDNIIGRGINDALELIGFQSLKIETSRAIGKIEKWSDNIPVLHKVEHFLTHTLWHPSEW